MKYLLILIGECIFLTLLFAGLLYFIASSIKSDLDKSSDFKLIKNATTKFVNQQRTNLENYVNK